MSEKRSNMFTDGTAALKMPRFSESAEDAKIIAFPTSRISVSPEQPDEIIQENAPDNEGHAVRAMRAVLDSSEMYCSLRYESIFGCPYRLFSKEGVAVLSVGASLIGVLSLILGS